MQPKQEGKVVKQMDYRVEIEDQIKLLKEEQQKCKGDPAILVSMAREISNLCYMLTQMGD
jgi:hypothetical protein